MKKLIHNLFFSKESENLEKKIINESNFEFDSKPRAWFGTGGNFSCVFKPKDDCQLEFFLKKIPKEIQVFPVGFASNLLVHDFGYQGGIILRFNKINHIFFNHLTSEINCGSGVPDKNLARFALENSIPGFEFLSTIPGNIGGALKMNAGCFGSEIKDIIKSASGFKRNGEKVFLKNEDFEFKYRESKINDIFFTNIVFYARKNQDEQARIFEKMEKFKSLRNESQPINVRTGGSTFKNPINYELKAWQLIDGVGLRGFRIGGAHFCEKHANFIVNDKQASSEDIKNLIEEAKERIMRKFNIVLKPEIVFLGF